MWMTLLARFWKPLAGALLILAALWWIYHHGFSAGYAKSEASWKPRFEAAERERDAANAKADAREQLARQLSRESDERYARLISDNNTRALDTQRDITRLVRFITARASGRTMPETSGSAGSPDAATSGDPRIDGAAASIGDTGRRCEADAIQLAELQRYVTEQLAVMR